MKANEIVNDVESSKTFLGFRKDHPKARLASIFDVGDGWTVGYYIPGDDRMVSFKGESMSEPQEVFKKGRSVKALDMRKVHFDIKEAQAAYEKIYAEKYKDHPIQTRFFLLHDDDGPIYNITIVTKTMSVVNIKIDAVTGDVRSDSIQSAMAFQDRTR